MSFSLSVAIQQRPIKSSAVPKAPKTTKGEKRQASASVRSARASAKAQMKSESFDRESADQDVIKVAGEDTPDIKGPAENLGKETTEE